MNASRSTLAMLAVATLVAASLFLAAAHAKKETPAPDADRLTKLQETCDRLTKENRELAGHLHKTKAELARTQETVKLNRQDLETAIDNNKKDAEEKIKAAREYNRRIEWKVVKTARLNRPDKGQVYEVDFGRPVIEAVAVLTRFDLDFPDTDRYLKRIFSQLEVEKIKGKPNAVNVRLVTFMHNDKGRDWAFTDQTWFVVIARVE